jgi:hypothetical protein
MGSAVDLWRHGTGLSGRAGGMEFSGVIPSSEVSRCIRVIVLAGGIYLGLHLVGFQARFANDAEGVGTLLQIIGTLYSVLYAFATYVIWGQFTAVENEILKESGALKDLLLFSEWLKANTREPIVRAVKSYARAVVDGEWRALANLEGTEKTDRLFREVIASVTGVNPEDDGERGVLDFVSALLLSLPKCGAGTGVDCDYHHAAVLRPFRADRPGQSI